MRAILISIGDELVLGQTVDTNAAWLASRLVERGIRCIEHRTVDDDLDAVAATLAEAACGAELLIVSGGLGPTDDDLTRPALAKAMSVELIEDPVSLARIEGFFRGRGREMPQRNRVQAMHPQTSTMIPNSCGTAPGIKAALGGATLYITPGVPREMKAMYEKSIEPELVESALPGAGVILTTKINTFGCGESDAARMLGGLMARDRNPVVGTTVSEGLVSVRIRAEYADSPEAAGALAETAKEVEQRLGAIAFGRGDATLQEALIHELVARGLTVATAESCTGGLIAAMLTDVPGSSAAVLGGWVTYANAAKTRELGVPAEMIEQHGAVSGPVVRAMTVGALKASGADLAVSTSGIAGPGGGSEEKPMGTVWLGLAWREGGEVKSEARVACFPGGRQAVRDRAAKCALQLLRLHVLGEEKGLVRWARET